MNPVLEHPKHEGWITSQEYLLYDRGILTGRVYPSISPTLPWAWESYITGAGNLAPTVDRARTALMLEHFQERQARVQIVVHRHRHHERRRR